MASCPICNAAARPREDNPSFPFCSARCKTIDLGKWMNEEYRIPGPESQEPETAEATFDFLPARSRREGGLYFTNDPRIGALTLRAKGYADP